MEPLDSEVQAATDQFLLDQLDFVLRCEWEPTCYYLAGWVGVFPYCQGSWNVCDNHREEANEYLKSGDHHLGCGGAVKKWHGSRFDKC